MTEHKMLLVENLTTGHRTNFSSMSIASSINFIKNQEIVNESINSLFENISPSDRFVLNDTLPYVQSSSQSMQLSAIHTGLVNVAMDSPEFITSGSDYVNLSIIKKAYDKFDDSVLLSSEGQQLLNKYNLVPSQLNAFDSDELLESLKHNQKNNRSINYLSEKTNTFVLHALPQFTPTANSPLDGELTRKEKIELLRSTDPEICCSTFKQGVVHDGYDFGGGLIGVIVSGGSVSYAANNDAGSVVSNNGTRHVIGHTQQEQLEVENVFADRVGNTGYNEVIVKNASVAGVYINLDGRTDSQKGLSLSQSMTPEKTLTMFMHLKTISKDDEKPLPILAIYKGELREISLNTQALKEFLPAAISNDLQGFNPNEYEVRLTATDQEKRLAWSKLSDDAFLNKSFIVGDPISQKDLHKMSNEHILSNSRKLEILDKNEKSLKGDIVANKISEIRSKHNDTELNVDFSVFENLNYQKSKNYLPSYSHRSKLSIS